MQLKPQEVIVKSIHVLSMTSFLLLGCFGTSGTSTDSPKSESSSSEMQGLSSDSNLSSVLLSSSSRAELEAGELPVEFLGKFTQNTHGYRIWVKGKSETRVSFIPRHPGYNFKFTDHDNAPFGADESLYSTVESLDKLNDFEVSFDLKKFISCGVDCTEGYMGMGFNLVTVEEHYKTSIDARVYDGIYLSYNSDAVFRLHMNSKEVEEGTGEWGAYLDAGDYRKGRVEIPWEAFAMKSPIGSADFYEELESLLEIKWLAHTDYSEMSGEFELKEIGFYTNEVPQKESVWKAVEGARFDIGNASGEITILSNDNFLSWRCDGDLFEVADYQYVEDMCIQDKSSLSVEYLKRSQDYRDYKGIDTIRANLNLINGARQGLDVSEYSGMYFHYKTEESMRIKLVALNHLTTSNEHYIDLPIGDYSVRPYEFLWSDVDQLYDGYGELSHGDSVDNKEVLSDLTSIELYTDIGYNESTDEIYTKVNQFDWFEFGFLKQSKDLRPTLNEIKSRVENNRYSR